MAWFFKRFLLGLSPREAGTLRKSCEPGFVFWSSECTSVFLVDDMSVHMMVANNAYH